MMIWLDLQKTMEQLSSELSASEENGHKPRPSTEFEGDAPKSWMIVGYNLGCFPSPRQMKVDSEILNI